MAWYRRVRKRDFIKVNGPAKICIKGGRAEVEVEADPTVKIDSGKDKKAEHVLKCKPRKG